MKTTSDLRTAALILIENGVLNVNDFSSDELERVFEFARMYKRNFEMTKIYETYTKNKTVAVFENFDEFCGFIKKKCKERAAGIEKMEVDFDVEAKKELHVFGVPIPESDYNKRFNSLTDYLVDTSIDKEELVMFRNL
jgi:hypothetical protein